MKKQITTLFLLFVIVNTVAQNVELVTEINSPMRMVFHGEDLYIAKKNPKSIVQIQIL